MPSYNILFVDDDEFIRKIYVDRLTAAGFTVTMSGTVPDALSKLAANSYDLVCVDYLLVDRKGVEIVEYIRKEKKSDMPVIVFSASGQDQPQKEALAAGATEFVVKDSVVPSEFAAKLKAIIDSRHQHA